MPYAPKRPCTYPGCATLTDAGRCDLHRRQEMREYNRQRGGSTAQGYGARWQRARAAYLQRHPLCVICRAVGRIVAATEVDHKIPHRGAPKLMWDEGNWQALCKLCHSRKTAREDGRWGVGKISVASVR